MNFCLLSINDAENLLAFELENRHWFEASIEKRSDDFYQLDKVKQHINKCLALYNKKLMYPALIKDREGNILARSNLRINNNGHDTFGYRVSEQASGKGVATFATQEMIRVAKDKFNLKQLSAFVSIENSASAAVLAKFGFKQNSYHPKMAYVQGQYLDCHQYLLAL